MAVMQPHPAQGFQSTYAPRLRQYANSLITPVLVTQALPTGRTTKRGTTVINYADDAYDDDDFDDSESARRPTGLRSLRREELEKREPQLDKLGKEIDRPTNVQPIFRHWIADSLRQRRPTTLQGMHAQAQFPLTLIPIRIEYEIPPHQQDTPFPLPQRQDAYLNLTAPAFRRPETSPGYKIRDIFMWNLHEALFTPEDFAINFVQDLDLPNANAAVAEIAKQIRQQLEEYAGVALHPLFHASPGRADTKQNHHASSEKANHNLSQTGTPRPFSRMDTPMRESATPRISTPAPSTPAPVSLPNGAQITAEATPMPEEEPPQPNDPFLHPDDTYRCIITLSLYHSGRSYADKFEWSLLHPPGAAEAFAKQTCADMGLNGEWVLAITHAIYEAVLRLKKETCEGTNPSTSSIWGQGEIDNQAVRPREGAGWRYDDADFGAEWEPRLEFLSQEEIEKREGDRERQLRRIRRETARFTSTTGMTPSAREQEAATRGSYFDFSVATPGAGDETPLMGRGERNRKKRKLRSPSPSAKDTTPAEPADAGWGGEANKLQEGERLNWRCAHCWVWGTAVWAVRGGPRGARTLCNNCGLLYERDKELPAWMRDLHRNKPKYPYGR